MGQLIQELKRRNVIRVAIAYAIAAWLLIEVSATTFPMLRLPDWTATFVMVMLMIGFPMALILAWAFEITPEGIKLEKHVVRDESITHVTGRKLDFIIIATLVVALGYFSYDKFILDPGRDAEMLQAAIDTVAGQEDVSQKSIAVLPFRNRSGVDEDAYFVDGIHDDILTQLTKLSALDKVISRTSMEQYRDTTKTIPQIGEELRVATILEGGVQRSGGRVRLNMQLIDAQADKHLWAETYDRKLTAENLFAIQSEIAREIAAALQIVLTDKEDDRLGMPPTTNLEAYTLFLKSRVPARRFTTEGFEEASRLLMQVLAIDPEYAAAWAELSLNQLNQVINKRVPLVEGYARAEVSARRALEIDAKNAPALVAIGAIEMVWHWNMKLAGDWFNRAFEASPGDARSLNALAMWTVRFGRREAALALFEKAVERDPLNVNFLANLGSNYSDAGFVDLGRTQLNAAKQIDPESSRIPLEYGWLEFYEDNHEIALSYSHELESPYDVLRACALHGLGRISEAQAELAGIEQRDNVHSYNVAQVYACWDEKDTAFEWLERAYQEHDPTLLSLRASRVMSSLHDDARWEVLLQKLGISDEHAEKLGL